MGRWTVSKNHATAKGHELDESRPSQCRVSVCSRVEIVLPPQSHDHSCLQTSSNREVPKSYGRVGVLSECCRSNGFCGKFPVRGAQDFRLQNRAPATILRTLRAGLMLPSQSPACFGRSVLPQYRTHFGLMSAWSRAPGIVLGYAGLALSALALLVFEVGDVIRFLLYTIFR